MPTVLRDGAYRVFFFSADCSEPAHVHVQRDRYIAKVWLHDLSLAQAGRYSPAELGAVIRMVRANRSLLLERWNEYCQR